MGWLKIGLNTENLYIIWKIVKIIKPNNMGSVGNAISTSIWKAAISDNGIDNGVKKTTGKKIVLKLKIEIKTTPTRKGKKRSK